MEKVSIELCDPAILPLNMYPKELKTYTETTTNTHRLVAAPDTLIQQPKGINNPHVHRWMNEKE